MIETQRGNSRPLGSTYSNQYTPRNDVYDPNHMNHHQNNDEQLNRNEFQQSNQSQYLKLEKSREEYNSNQYNFHNDNAHQSQANQPEQLNPQHHYSDYDNQHNTNFTHTHQQDGYHHIYPNSDPDNNNLYQNHHLNTTQSKQQTYNTIVTSTTTNLPSQYDYNIQLNSQLNNENVNQSMEDPLGRIKGHALAVFSQGKLITHFPKKQSRIENQTMVEKVVAGPITIRPVYESLYKDTRDSIEQNQGPLFGNKKTKKKKDVLGIIDLALSKDSLNQDQILYHQILRMIIEADGNKL